MVEEPAAGAISDFRLGVDGLSQEAFRGVAVGVGQNAGLVAVGSDAVTGPFAGADDSVDGREAVAPLVDQVYCLVAYALPSGLPVGLREGGGGREGVDDPGVNRIVGDVRKSDRLTFIPMHSAR